VWRWRDEQGVSNSLAALEQSADDSGWAPLATLGSYVSKLQPDFDARLRGFRKLSELVMSRASSLRFGAQSVLRSRDRRQRTRMTPVATFRELEATVNTALAFT
jgi:hypothetical protein